MAEPRSLPAGQAKAYLTAKFDQAAKAVSRGDTAGAAAVVAQMKNDGFTDAADCVLDGFIAAGLRAEVDQDVPPREGKER